MVELPECWALARQLNETVMGRRIVSAQAGHTPHKWAWFAGDPARYDELLAGRTLTGASPGAGYTCGGNTEIIAQDRLLIISTPIRYHAPGEKVPDKHHLLLTLDDGSALRCTVQMWGAMLAFPLNEVNLPDYIRRHDGPSPLSDGFDRAYFDSLMAGDAGKLSVKALLATGQRIPGLGNGVLQDILFNAGLHPRRTVASLSGDEKEKLFVSLKQTLRDMADQGGRDTEQDLFGNPGGYVTTLSSKTWQRPCPVCGESLRREAYLGGNVYFCPTCQAL